MTEGKRLSVVQARRVVELAERCAEALKAGNKDLAIELCGDASVVSFRGSQKLNAVMDQLEWALDPDDEPSGCVRCGEECPHCGPQNANPGSAVVLAIAAATAELEAAERAAYVPRKAVEA